MSKHPNNTPEQKAAWLATRGLGSSKIKFIPSEVYSPEPKPDSRRDIKRRYGRINKIRFNIRALQPMPKVLIAALYDPERFLNTATAS